VARAVEVDRDRFCGHERLFHVGPRGPCIKGAPSYRQKGRLYAPSSVCECCEFTPHPEDPNVCARLLRYPVR
jgi:hypothetical protein